MNKAELALRISEKLQIPKKTAEDFVEQFEEMVTQALVDGNEVTIAGSAHSRPKCVARAWA